MSTRKSYLQPRRSRLLVTSIDVAVLARLRADLGGDDDVMRELADAFLSQSPRLIEDARVAAAARAGDRLARAVHTLKSSAATLGATQLAHLARDLEADAMAGTVRDAPARVRALATEYASVEHELRAWVAPGGHQK